MSDLTFYTNPMSRGRIIRWMLEEVGQPYETVILPWETGAAKAPEYLAINPMGKVPAIRHGEALVTEQVAVYLYLADLFPQAGLTPAIGEPLRGPFLRWLAFYGSSFEPALVDKSQGHAPPPAMAPYGDYDTMLATLVAQLERGPYILGERFSAADVLWGTALNWTTMFKLVPELPVIKAYVARTNARPAFVRAREKDEALLASQQGRG